MIFGWTPDAFANSSDYRHALIIGVAIYRDEDVPPLFGVPDDMDSAREISAALGITPENIKELFNKQATKNGIIRELKRLAKEAKEGSKILIYFSGHGTRWNDPKVGGCVEGLLTWDRKTIINREFAELVRPIGLRAENLIIMFDACHSGGVYSTRSLRDTASKRFTPKFFARADTNEIDCSRPSNVVTRSLFERNSAGSLTLPQNVVHIMSSRADEVSFDEPGKGGLATQSIKRCLLGGAKDTDGSGAITLTEVQECAQEFIRAKLKPYPDFLPHHISILGFRNLIPVATSPSVAGNGDSPADSTQIVTPDDIRREKENLALAQQLEAERVEQEEQSLAAQREEQARLEREKVAQELAEAEAERDRLKKEEAADALQRIAEERVRVQRLERARLEELAQLSIPDQVADVSITPTPIDLGPAAAFDNIFDQRDRRREVTVTVPTDTLKINEDSLSMTIQSSHAGYVYIFLLGSDEISFYLLFPNSMDRENYIDPDTPIKIPRPHWKLAAAGPPGMDRILTVVTETPRQLDKLSGLTNSTLSPLILTPATIDGRRKLIEFILGPDLSGTTRLWAAQTFVREVP